MCAATRRTRAGDTGLVDLRVFLYSGVVRDKDPDWFFLFEDPSDVSCQLTVETGDTQEVRLSDIVRITASHYFGIVPLHVNREHQMAYLQTASALLSSLSAMQLQLS